MRTLLLTITVALLAGCTVFQTKYLPGNAFRTTSDLPFTINFTTPEISGVIRYQNMGDDASLTVLGFSHSDAKFEVDNTYKTVKLLRLENQCFLAIKEKITDPEYTLVKFKLDGAQTYAIVLPALLTEKTIQSHIDSKLLEGSFKDGNLYTEASRQALDTYFLNQKVKSELSQQNAEPVFMRYAEQGHTNDLKNFGQFSRGCTE